jgi:parvulin-like peptidyl-prolyl cis-trans isomerase-like protein
MQVDKGDAAIRERVIFKALSVIDANVKLPPVDDQQLRAWFEQHRAKYDQPARYNFEEAVLARAGAAAVTEAEIRDFVDGLNRGALGDNHAGLRVFKDRPHTNLVQSYGAEFPQQLAGLTPGPWRALAARDGWHAVRLDSIVAPQPAAFEPLRGVVLQDWTDATAAEQRTAAVRALAKKYNVIFESRPE